MKSNASAKRSFIIMVSTLLLVLTLTACNYERYAQNSTYDYGSKQKGDPKLLGSRMYGATSSNPGQHNNRWFEYSSQLSAEISNINGVAAGMVFLTDKNAYVGMTLDSTAVGTRKTGGDGAREQIFSGQSRNLPRVSNTNRDISYEQQFAGPQNSYRTINDHNQISSELKQTVAIHIRRLAPMVQEVHISANMDFVNAFSRYAYEARLGHSLSPWTPSFNELVKHQFAEGNVAKKD